MKAKCLALTLAAALVLSACGDRNETNDFNVKDPMFDDGGENDIGT